MSFVDWLILHGYDASYAQGPKKDVLYRMYQQSLKEGNNAVYNKYVDQYKEGDMSAIDLQGVLANSGISVTPEQTQWINNEISQQVTGEARDYNTQMRDSSLTSSAYQLASLGMNPASVLQTGGAGIGSSSVADTSKGNPAQEKAMADFQAKAALTRTLIGLIGGLGSAGILGGSQYLAKRAAAVAASSTANSGLNAIKYNYGGINDRNYEKKWNDLLRDLDY